MARLPISGSDNGVWGDVLNDFLVQVHNGDGTLKDDVVGTSQIQDGAIGDIQVSSLSQSKIAGLSTALASKANDSTVVHKGDLILNVKDYGAVGDGTTDDTTAITNAITAAGTKKIVLLPTGTYRITSTISLPDNITLKGEGIGATVLQVPAGSTFRVLDIDGKSKVAITDLSITKASGTALSGTAYGVSIRGASQDITVEKVWVDSFVRGVNVAGGEGTSTGTCRRIVLRNVTGINSPTNFGINVDDADTVLLDSCYGRNNWLDGFKLRKMTKNVTVIGGAYTDNGVSGTGDGADCYAGGDRFFIAGTTFEANIGNGLTIKTGDLQQSDPTGYGYVRNVDLVGIRCVGNTNGSGCQITVSDPLDTTEPLVSLVSVTGGYFAENTGASSDGLYINARNVTVSGAKCRRNQRNGITVASRSFDVTLTGCVVLANGLSAGSGTGIDIQGKRVQVLGGTVMGVDADTVAQESDYASLTKYHGRNISVASTASDVFINFVEEDYNNTSQGILCNMTTGSCLINQRGTGVPNSVGVYGSIGSTWIRTDASGTDVAYEKTSGAPNAATTGWSRRLHGAAVAAVLDFPSINAASATTLTVSTGASSGIAVTDCAIATPPSNLPSGIMIKSWVSASNTVTVELYNATAGTIDPPSGTWRIAAVKV